jgi:DEAD/DEAH box helicase domain-containing protein
VGRYLNSFIAALQLGLKLKFGGKVDHLRVMTYAEPVPDSEAKRRYLMLYDSVPGGTGYLQDLMQAPGTLLELFRLARDHMVACVCNHESPDKDGCYRCLYAYRNSYGMESTSRSTAVELLGRVLDQEARFETIESIDSIKINPVFDSELEALFIGALAKPKAFDVPVNIQQQVINGKPGWFLSVGDHYYTIEPQVNLGEDEGVVFGSKPDFLIRSANALDAKPFLPVALFLDGFKYHKQTTAEDSAKRLALVRSGRYRVWSLTWDDVQTKFAGSAVKSRNPFNEGLQPKMQPVQKGLQDKLGISHLFKAAVSPPMAQLLSFLADPDWEHWRGLAFVRMLGWFDQQSMCGPDQAETMRRRFLEQSPTAMAQHFDQMGESAYGGLDRADDLLRIDCVVPLNAIHEIEPESALCNIRLDDRAPGDEVFKPAWQAFLKAYNLLQFLPFTGVSTDKGMASGLYESIPWVSGERSELLVVDDGAARAFLDEVVEELRGPLARWLEQGGEQPLIGFELQGDGGEIIAESELAWLETRTAGLLPEQAEYQELFEQQGWRVVMLDDSGGWMDQLLG